MTESRRLTRRQFAGLGASAVVTGLGVIEPAVFPPEARGGQAGAGAPGSGAPRPEALRSEFLMDLILETQPAVPIGPRTAVAVTGGTFEGPKLRGKVISPAADWPLLVN